MPTLKITEQHVEYGVKFDDGFVAPCQDKDEAEMIAHLTEGKLRARDILVSEWYKPSKADQ